jgi:DNA polymerase-3 subunit delta'
MPGRLLTTIRSRCRVLNFQPLGDDDVKKAACQALGAAGIAEPEDGQWPVLLAAAEGRVANLLSLASDDGLALSKKVDQVFRNLMQTDWVGVHQLSDEFSAVAGNEKFESFVDLLLARLARTIKAAALDTGNDEDLKTAQRLGVKRDLASWAELWETLVREKATQAGLNLDRKAFVLDCVIRLRQLATG